MNGEIEVSIQNSFFCILWYCVDGGRDILPPEKFSTSKDSDSLSADGKQTEFHVGRRNLTRSTILGGLSISGSIGVGWCNYTHAIYRCTMPYDKALKNSDNEKL